MKKKRIYSILNDIITFNKYGKLGQNELNIYVDQIASLFTPAPPVTPQDENPSPEKCKRNCDGPDCEGCDDFQLKKTKKPTPSTHSEIVDILHDELFIVDIKAEHIANRIIDELKLTPTKPVEITEEEIKNILDEYIRFNACGMVENAWISEGSKYKAAEAILTKLNGEKA